MFGKRIVEIRKEHNLTQKQLGEILNANQRTISQYEKESRDLNTDTIIKICIYFDISADYLLGIDKELDKNNIFFTSKAKTNK